MRALWALAPLVLVACSDDAVVVSLPVWGDAIESWIVARQQNGVVEVRAADRADPTIELDFGSGSTDLELRGYPRALADLRLPRGIVPSFAAGTFPRSLPGGSVQLVAHIEGTAVSPWVMGGLPEVAAFQLGVTDPCAKLTAVTTKLMHRERVAWGVSLDHDSVLLGTAFDFSDNAIMLDRIHREHGASSLSMRYDGAYEPRLHGAFKDATGALWLGDADGGLWSAMVTDDALLLTRVVGPTAHGSTLVIDGDPRDPRGNLFTVTSSGVLASLAGDHWVDRDALPITDRIDPKVGLAWLGANDVLYGTSSGPMVHRWRSSTDVTALSTNDEGGGITGMMRLDGTRVVIASGTGLISIFEDGRLEQLGPSELRLNVLAFAPLGDGFLYTGTNGYVGEYNSEAEFCDIADAPLAAGSVRVMLPLGDALLLAGDPPSGTDRTSYTVVTVDRP